MTTATIRSYFEGKLKTFADAQSPVVPIAFENAAFTKPTSGLFLECFIMPSTTINPSTDAVRKREVGICQVNCWSLQGIGTKAGMALAQSIVDLFPVVPKGTVSIESTPSVERGMLDQQSGWFIIPVVITYRYES